MDENQNFSIVKYRPFSMQDSRALREVLRGAWDLQEYSRHPAVTEILLEHYLCTYLAQQNYTNVATVNGKPVGFLFGRFERTFCHRAVRKYRMQKRLLSALLACIPRGRDYLRDSRQIEEADNRLIAGRHYDSELVLFAVHSDYRGLGIGRRLQEDYQNYLSAMGADSMFLYTDEFSNVGFYRAQGYQQVGKTAVSFPKSTKPAVFYLFTGPKKETAQSR